MVVKLLATHNRSVCGSNLRFWGLSMWGFHVIMQVRLIGDSKLAVSVGVFAWLVISGGLSDVVTASCPVTAGKHSDPKQDKVASKSK